MSALLQPSKRPTRILVVDDNALVRKYLRDMLEIHGGWRVCDEAEDGKQAIETFRKTRPDLVVLDFQMPAMNGLEAAGIMRRLSPDTPILIVTLYPSRQLTEEAKNLGVKGACAKADLRTVADAVNALLRRETYFQL